MSDPLHTDIHGESPAPDFLRLPSRGRKPRDRGLTLVIDRGLSLPALEALLEVAGPHVDLVKFGWGTAYVSQGMRAKVTACREAGVRACTGGTLLEIAAAQGKVTEFRHWVASLGIDTVEVSEGSVGLGRGVKRRLISELASDFRVVAEVGSKDPSVRVRPLEWVDHMLRDLDAGASLVVAEGRESGTVGLYGPDGEVREFLVDAILGAVPSDRVVFEAPSRVQQAWFVRRVGPDVNLGNVPADEVLPLETLRRGLRADTVDLAVDRSPADAERQPAARFDDAMRK